MSEQPLRILQVSTYDTIGGAEKVAWNLSRTYRAHGHASWLAVGHKLGSDPHVLLVPNLERRRRWSRLSHDLYGAAQAQKGSRLSRLVHALAEPGRTLDYYLGVEDFRFPGTRQILKLNGQPPDIVHAHNLHGGYFDLRLLPWLSHEVPVVLTLHDAWLLSGHCAHSVDCERWKIGCGRCPDLTLDPAIRRDATAYNWQRKREIFRKSRVYVATPSRWLMQKVEQSMLMSGVAEARVIPNGVDLATFHPADKGQARAVLGLPQAARVLLFTANAVRRNPWKDYQTVRNAIALIGGRSFGQDIIFIALGEDAPVERIGSAEVRFIPYQREPDTVARYYQAADVYVHAARADTFPNSVLEALACGTPVVATSVGGIPEQIEDNRTGFLVPVGDAETLAMRIGQLLSDDALKASMGTEAATVARCRFDLERQADVYLTWYHKLIQQHASVSRLRSN